MPLFTNRSSTPLLSKSREIDHSLATLLPHSDPEENFSKQSFLPFSKEGERSPFYKLLPELLLTHTALEIEEIAQRRQDIYHGLFSRNAGGQASKSLATKKRGIET